MDKVGGETGNGQTVATQRRPQTEQNSSFQRLPLVKDTSNYIFITQDILDAFKDKVVQSHKITLKLNTFRKKERQQSSQRNNLPNLLPEKFRLLHGKAYTSLDLRDMVPRRPVRVFVDDITQQAHSPVDQTNDFKGNDLMKINTSFKKQKSNISPDSTIKR